MKYLLIVACFVFVSLSGTEGCDHVTTPKLIWNGSKGYYFGTYAKMNWYNAYEFCRYQGMQLATVNNVEEKKFIMSKILSSAYTDESYWTSGTDLAREGDFIWMSTGVSLPKSPSIWGPTEPNNLDGNENCVSFFKNHNFDINDITCTSNYYVICETVDC